VRRSKGSTSRKPHAAKPGRTPAPSAIIDNAPADIKLIFKPELLELLHVSYSSIFSWMRAGKFPLAHIIGPSSGRSSRIAWYASEVQAWLASRPQRQIKPPP
jgi:predicted DNA-binding transcriptional regulator AlpA